MKFLYNLFKENLTIYRRIWAVLKMIKKFTLKQKWRIFIYRSKSYMRHIWGRYRNGADTWFLRPSSIFNRVETRINIYLYDRKWSKIYQERLNNPPILALQKALSPLEKKIERYKEIRYKLALNYWNFSEKNKIKSEKLRDILWYKIQDLKKLKALKEGQNNV